MASFMEMMLTERQLETFQFVCLGIGAGVSDTHRLLSQCHPLGLTSHLKVWLAVLLTRNESSLLPRLLWPFHMRMSTPT